MLTAKRLRKWLKYNPTTGVFCWRVGRHNRAQIGDVAGCIVSRGHRIIVIDGKQYRANRLAWLYMTGKWPKLEINYMNHNASDTRWANLREMTPTQRRRRARRTNKHGVRGVWKTQTGRYVAQIKKAGKRTYIGVFDTIEEAGAAYAKVAKRTFGELVDRAHELR